MLMSRRSSLTALLTSMTFVRHYGKNPTSIIGSNLLHFSTSTSSKRLMDVYLALGSNLGDRSLAISQAIQELRTIGNVKCTSFLYETIPMYHSDQSNFLNAVCLLQTDLQPLDLLGELQRIEKHVGRETTFRNGPRVIDLDILMYGKKQIHSAELEIPHPRIAERCFVLQPLRDIVTTNELLLPDGSGALRSVAELYQNLPQASKDEVRRVMPVYNHLRKQTQLLGGISHPQKIMGILNVTPDSFSDGGSYSEDVSAAVRQAQRMEAEGASIIDIGGESTRPGADTIPVQEELRRVIPVIRAIRATGSTCMISIDTRKAEVARQAILAGADMVNDVSAGRFDPQMLAAVGALGVPYIAMHMRGEPQTMQQPQHLHYQVTTPPGAPSATAGSRSYAQDVVQVVAAELGEQLAVIDEHIPRWLQLVDPGIGFAKGYEENMALLQPAHLLRFKQLLGERPVVAGFSRKKFLNRVLGEGKAQRGLLSSAEAVAYSASEQEKDLATAAGCAALTVRENFQFKMFCRSDEVVTSNVMEKLISHLQQTLDEDEAAKEALLLLRDNGVTQAKDLLPKLDAKSAVEIGPIEDVLDSRSSMFILQSITSKLIQDSHTNLDLPVKVAAMQLHLSPRLLMEVCFLEDSYTEWPHNFISCIQRVLEVCKVSAERGMLILSSELKNKLKSLLDKIKHIRTEPRGAVAKFILGTIIAYADAIATPLPLEQDAMLLHSAGPEAAGAPLATKELCYTDLILHSRDYKARAIMLAPLVLKPRSPKHFIVPLMEPDLHCTTEVALYPSVASLVVCAKGGRGATMENDG